MGGVIRDGRRGEGNGNSKKNENERMEGINLRCHCFVPVDEKSDEKWILFDSPVDTLWIESMNSVMDDNKVLTLINGERISMPEQVSTMNYSNYLITIPAPFVCVSVCPNLSMYVYMPACLSLCVSVCLCLLHLIVCLSKPACLSLSACLSVCLTVCLSACLPVFLFSKHMY